MIAARDEFELVLRRVAYGARLLGLVWWAVLSMLVVVEGVPEWEWVPIVTAVLAVGWALTSSMWFRADPFSTTSKAAIATDIILGVVAIVAPSLAYGTPSPPVLFYGGFPFIVVVVASIRGSRIGWAAAVVLSATVSYQLFPTGTGVFVFPISQVVVYLAGAFIATWAMRVLRRSEEEIRAARDALTRAEERAEISQHLHDSVLQTLALIQRSSDDGGEVVRLARRQERELRDWLYGSGSGAALGLSDAVRAAAAEVEDAYGVTIDVVAVGDAPPGAQVEALTAAAREAMVNAAKHSGSDSISVYAESDGMASRVYVRDRGRGFDRDAIASDRQGIAGSIEARLERVGGHADLRTTEGRGTEWALEVTR